MPLKGEDPSCPEIHYMHIAPKSYVVSEVPAHVIGVLVNYNLVTVPEPVIAEGEVGCRYAEIVAAEPETSRASAL
jgi:hypothetical protein